MIPSTVFLFVQELLIQFILDEVPWFTWLITVLAALLLVFGIIIVSKFLRVRWDLSQILQLFMRVFFRRNCPVNWNQLYCHFCFLFGLSPTIRVCVGYPVRVKFLTYSWFVLLTLVTSMMSESWTYSVSNEYEDNGWCQIENLCLSYFIRRLSQLLWYFLISRYRKHSQWPATKKTLKKIFVMDAVEKWPCDTVWVLTCFWLSRSIHNFISFIIIVTFYRLLRIVFFFPSSTLLKLIHLFSILPGNVTKYY